MLIGEILTEEKERKIAKLLNSFGLSTGIGVTIYDTQGGRVLDNAGMSGMCEFCRIIETSDEGVKRCAASVCDAGNMAFHLGEPYVSRCHAGLVRVSVALKTDQLIGFLIGGPFLMWNWEEASVAEFLNHISDLPINREALMASARNLSAFSGKTITAVTDILQLLAHRIEEDLSVGGALGIPKAEELNIAKSLLQKGGKSIAENESVISAKSSDSDYPLHLERKLASLVELGDRAGAREALNEIVGTIFASPTADIDAIKVRVIELISVLSRAALQGGASSQLLLGSNYYLVQMMSALDDIDSICVWLPQVLDYILSLIYESRKTRGMDIIAEALKYIRDNYMQDISLESVASSVHISPYYLSHLLKEEKDITFISYLTSLRIEQAKWLLKTTTLSVVEIADRIGYADSGYFSKVFKKSTGFTPIAYRKSGEQTPVGE